MSSRSSSSFNSIQNLTSNGRKKKLTRKVGPTNSNSPPNVSNSTYQRRNTAWQNSPKNSGVEQSRREKLLQKILKQEKELAILYAQLENVRKERTKKFMKRMTPQSNSNSLNSNSNA